VKRVEIKSAKRGRFAEPEQIRIGARGGARWISAAISGLVLAGP